MEKQLIIWVVTAWFPNEDQPFNGTFVKEQVSIMNRQANCRYKFIIINPYMPLDIPNILFRNKRLNNSVTIIDDPAIEVIQYQNFIFTHRIPFDAIFKLRKIAKKSSRRALQIAGSPDIIWAVTLSGLFTSILIKRLLNIPARIIYHEHSNPLTMHLRYSWQKKLAMGISKEVFRTIVVAERQVEELNKVIAISDCEVIPNPANDIFFDYPLKSTIKDIVTIISIGNLGVPKNQIVQIRAAARLLKQGLPFKWIVLGEGPDRHGLEQEIKNNRLEANFFLPGNASRMDVAEQLSQATIYVHTSVYENCPVSVIEAQAMGLPCIVFRNGASEKVLLEGNGTTIEADETGERLFRELLKMLETRTDKQVIRDKAAIVYRSGVFRKNMERIFEAALV